MSEPVDKDEFCRCSCHTRDRLDSSDCPLCYFSDGNRELNERVDEHCAKYGQDDWGT